MSPCLLATLLALAEPLQVSASGPAAAIDLEAMREGIDARVGAAATDWSVEVLALEGRTARLRLRPPAPAATVLRSITFDSDDPSGRARELASAVALLIETHRPPAPIHEPAPPPSRPAQDPPRVFISVGGVLGLGLRHPADVSGGVRLEAGGILLHEHVLPRAYLGWQSTRRSALQVDALEVGAGLSAGGALGPGVVWLGAGAFGDVVVAFVRDAAAARAWAGRVYLPLTLQVRPARAVAVTLDAGPAIYLPALRFIGADATVRWRTVRARAVLSVGWRFG